jgi:hypothetical protein
MIRLVIGTDVNEHLKLAISSINVGSYRTCKIGNYKLIESSPWAEKNQLFPQGNWLLCNAQDRKSFNEEYTHQSNTLSFKISSDDLFTLRDLGIYLVEQYAQKEGETIIPICGRPDIPYGVMIYTRPGQTAAREPRLAREGFFRGS